MDDYYKILGVSRLADEKEIRTAYRRLVRQFHPDAGPGSSAETFCAVQDAYDLLIDPDRRSEYDRNLESEERGRAEEDAPLRSTGSVHIDLRDFVSSRRSAPKMQAEPLRTEPLRTRSGVRSIEAEWDELLNYFFDDLGLR